MPRTALANSSTNLILSHTLPLLSLPPPPPPPLPPPSLLSPSPSPSPFHHRLLQKCSLVQTSKVLERDTQRQELGKLRLSQDNLNTTLQEQREELQRLTQHINTTEHQLNRVSLEAGLLTLGRLRGGTGRMVPNRKCGRRGSLIPNTNCPPPPPHTHTHTSCGVSMSKLCRSAMTWDFS